MHERAREVVDDEVFAVVIILRQESVVHVDQLRAVRIHPVVGRLLLQARVPLPMLRILPVQLVDYEPVLLRSVYGHQIAAAHIGSESLQFIGINYIF